MFYVGSYVQIRDGRLGEVVKIASARQTLTIRTLTGEVVRLRGSDVRRIDSVEWRMLHQQQEKQAARDGIRQQV